jgi:hypothetical protein
MMVRALKDLESPVGAAVADALEGLRLPSGPTPDVVPPPPLDAEKTDLRAIADHLCRPARCGLFLSAAVIERIGRRTGVPRGFGDRRRILGELLRTAGRYEQLPEVLGLLLDVVGDHATSGDPRVEATSRWLSEVRSALL